MLSAPPETARITVSAFSTSGFAPASRSETKSCRLLLEDRFGGGDEFFDMAHAFRQGFFLVRIEIDLEDLFNPRTADQGRHADEVTADAVFLLTKGGGGKDAFAIADDGVVHLRHRRSRC